jgi:hypothetical protein
MSGATQTFTVNIPDMPVYCALNYDAKIGDATSHETKVIKSAGNVSFGLGKIFMQVQNAGIDSSLLRVVHNYVKPDPFKYNPLHHKLSDQHFWKVEGIVSSGFVSKARFNYDGNKTVGGTYSYMDTLLTQVNADSINLFYRRDAHSDWELITEVTKFSTGLRSGYIQIDTLRLGEYTFGNYGDSSLVSIEKRRNNNVDIKIYPNPAGSSCTVEFKHDFKNKCTVSILDSEGKTVRMQEISSRITQLDISALAKGMYLLCFRAEGRTFYSQKLVLKE